MAKVSIVLINYLALFFMSIFSMEDVLVENNTPAVLAPGKKQRVEIVVNKGDVQGFSKLELTLPPGFTASPDDTKGASFTFSGQKAKFVWMNLPSEADFKLTYFIESAEDMEGVYNVTGAFSYVKNNKRVDFNIPTKTVQVKKTLEPTPEQAAQTMPTIKREAEFIEMVCERTITKTSETEFTVNLKVVNNNIVGFGKILETVPDNCNTEKINDGGAVLTQDKNTIKFVWFDVPAAGSFEVSYRMSCVAQVGDPIITGQLSYTEDGTPVVVQITQAGGVEGSVAQTIPEDIKQETIFEIAKTETPIKEEIKSETVTRDIPETNTTAEVKPSTTPVTSIPSAEKGISYKVQILAAHRVVNKTYFTDKFSFNEKFNIENHQGWVKYTTGNFTEYKDARDARETIKGNHGKLPGPFVTAYNDGERITVQEALLINKQQWYK